MILVTGHCGDEEDAVDWAALAQTGQPIVLYMGLSNLEQIAASLMDAGLDPHEPVAVIASATLPEERILISELHRVAAETRALALRGAGHHRHRRHRESEGEASRPCGARA